MQSRPTTQRVLFDEVEPQPCPQLSPELRAQVLKQLVLWMQAVAVSINQEVVDEQDHR